MNPMTNVKNIKKLNEQELRRNLKTSWHDQYKDSAWIFIGGLPYDLTEGDVICVFSQYGEVVNINLVREKDTGKPRGFCFLCYEDQRSTVLAVDNFNGMKLLGRTLRVDHVAGYKAPKDSAKKDAETRRLQEEGCAITPETNLPNVKKEKEDNDDCIIVEKDTSSVDVVKDIKSESKKKKKEKRKKKKEKVSPKVKVKKENEKKKRLKRRSSSGSDSEDSTDNSSSDSDSSSDSRSEESSSDSEEDNNRLRRHRQKQSRKMKAQHYELGAPESESSATSKRRKLEEKIKALEKALNSVRSGKSKQK